MLCAVGRGEGIGEMSRHSPLDTTSSGFQGGIKRFSFLPEVTQTNGRRPVVKTWVEGSQGRHG